MTWHFFMYVLLLCYQNKEDTLTCECFPAEKSMPRGEPGDLQFRYIFHVIKDADYGSWENLFMPYANNKGANQPAHLCSLTGAFVVHCLDGIIQSLLVIYSRNFKTLASLCSWAGRLESYRVPNPRKQVFPWRVSFVIIIMCFTLCSVCEWYHLCL